MSDNPVQQANRVQAQASDPRVSAFVGASAGSGKTKLLTDRILRLLLSGVPPERILCLTFTKAAAAEMAIRLRRAVASWATAPDESIRQAMIAIGENPSPHIIARARDLLPIVLDAPGGLKIGTIHSFCQALLRRFPLEAQVSPHFAVEDQSDASLRLARSRDEALADDNQQMSIASLAAEQNDEQFTTAVQDMLRGNEAIGRVVAQHGVDGVVALQRLALGLGQLSDEDIWSEAISVQQESPVVRSLRWVAQNGSEAAKSLVSPALSWLSLSPDARRAQWSSWVSVFRTGTGTPRQAKSFIGKAALEANPDLITGIIDEQNRLELICEKIAAASLAQLSAALVRIGSGIMAHDGAAKLARNKLDYDDLIVKTTGLLVDPGAAWVLFKLDGGIDHLLLDEAQDISPAQWPIIGSLVDDFFSGDARHDRARTVFAVGDAKQSIYSFQGADLETFNAWREILKRKVIDGGQKWVDGALAVSFRTTPTVLTAVDEVFLDPAANHGVDHVGHLASRTGQAGSVEVWPLVAKPETPEVPIWAPSDIYQPQITARSALATAISDWMYNAIGRLDLPSRGRQLLPGDVLILVRSRNEFGLSMVRSLKDAGIPVAGLDRLQLTENRAVLDLMAAGDAVLLPRNDLALATLLVSPIVGLDDASLMDLATGRTGSLIGSLFARADERPEWAAARDIYRSLQTKADFVSPYKFFMTILGDLNGRGKLMTRLGPESAEPIDEFISQALHYGQGHNPTLQGFLHHIETSATEIKREAEVSGAAVRIMTVHGAKGLQAPVVILPDTTFKPTVKDRLFWLSSGDGQPHVPILCPRTTQSSAAVTAAREVMAANELREHNRLLYVAMTRAEDRLIVCGTDPAVGAAPESWYSMIKNGVQRMGGVQTVATTHLPWPGSIIKVESVQTAEPDRLSVATDRIFTRMPTWITGADRLIAPPPAEAGRIERIVPSKIEEKPARDVSAGRPRGFGGGRAAAMERGTAIHALLQYLPDIEPERREELAMEFMSGRGFRRSVVVTLVRDTMRVLDDPSLAGIFSSEAMAEVPVVGIVDDVEIAGVVDRMSVGEDRVIFVDFKTDRYPAQRGKIVPQAYRVQTEAYGKVLAQAFPGRSIEGYIVWTSTGVVAQAVQVGSQALKPNAAGARSYAPSV